jgi:hypothetical protein
MKYLLFFLFLLTLDVHLCSQPGYDIKRDYVWIFGGKKANVDSTIHTYLDFRYDTMTLNFRTGKGHNLFQTNASICDTAGNFLFFSNGCVLVDSSFKYIPGASIINNGPFWAENCESNYPDITDGYVFVNGCWILPVAEKKFKVLYADQNNNNYHTSGIRYSTVIQDEQTVQLRGNNVDKYLIESDLSPEKRAIVRHANGRDWWFVNNSYASKDFFVSYIDSSENVYEPQKYDFPELPLQKFTGGGQSVFSPDGTIYTCFDPRNFCQIYDFNRCTGELSNVRLVYPLLSYDSIFSVTGCAISPNSRFLYLMTRSIITQYDLQAINIEASAIIVATRDSWSWIVNGVNYDPSFYQSQLGPDGKIYVFNAANRFTFAVIESPDSMGLACNVIQHKYFFPEGGAVRQPPRFPNFRLGAMTGSPCDTIVYISTSSAARPQASMKLLPNPATDYTVADISVGDYSENQQLMLSVVDVSGREVKRKSVSAYTSLQRIETGDLVAGLYFVRLWVRGRVVAVNKLVVVKD